MAAALLSAPDPDAAFPPIPDNAPELTQWLAGHLLAEAAQARHSYGGPLHPATLAHLRVRLWLAETEAAALAGWRAE